MKFFQKFLGSVFILLTRGSNFAMEKEIGAPVSDRVANFRFLWPRDVRANNLALVAAGRHPEIF